MTYKVKFAASKKGGYMLEPEAYLQADSFAHAHEKFVVWAQTELDGYDVTITSIHTDSAFVVEGS